MENVAVNIILPEQPTCEINERGFKVYEIREGKTPPNYSRRDFYKICLVTGTNRIQYADRTIDADGTILFFGNPHVPYSWESISHDQQGYVCIFTDSYFSSNDRAHSLQHFSFFKIEGSPVMHLNVSEKAFIEMVFRKMLSSYTSEYVFRDELMRDYIRLIFHEAQRVQPKEKPLSIDASSRMASLFLELLARQFPIERPDQRLALRQPKDYANHLSVHVNHLNYTVHKVTGKSTTRHIAERITNEAKSLIKRTNWSIADIAYCLGFEYPTHFTNYFKRVSGITPKSIRDSLNE